MLVRKGFSRRQLLQSASSAILYYPLLRTLDISDAMAQSGAITPRAIFVYFPSGTYRDKFWPAGNTGPIGTLPVVTQDLEKHKQDMILFHGLNLVGATNHNGAMPQVLAGWGACSRDSAVQICGKNPGFPNNDNTTTRNQEALPYSLDQRLADTIGAKSIKPFVNMGIQTSASGNPFKEPVSWKKNGAPNMPQDNPKASFDDLFGSIQTKEGTTQQALALASINQGKKRLVDYLIKDIKRIEGNLGSHEKLAFQAHLSALDDINRDINNALAAEMPEMGGGGGGGGGGGEIGNPMICTPNGTIKGFPTSPNNWYMKTEHAPVVYELQRRIMVQAMACNLTRVGVWQMGCSHQESHIPARDVKDDPGVVHHLLAHLGNEAFTSNQQGQMREISKMVDDLKALKIGDRSLFDETIVYTSTCIGDNANAHGGNNIATFILGSLGGKIKTGRMIKLNNRPYNHALLTVAQLMGADIKTIGNLAATGPIAEVFT